MTRTRPSPSLRKAYKVVDGHEVHLDVYLPPKPAASPTPIIVWIHGGGFVDGCSSDMSDPQLFPVLERGWALIALEHRLAPQVLIQEQVKDIIDACGVITSGEVDRWLGSGKIDSTRWALTGSSAGGLLAILAGLQAKPAPSVIAPLYAACDLTHPSFNMGPIVFPSPFQLNDVAHYINPDGPVVSRAPANVDFTTMSAGDRTAALFYLIQEGMHLKCVAGTTDPEQLRSVLPTTYLSAKSPPIVVTHGTGDTMVPPAVAEAFVSAGIEAGVDVTYLPVAGKNHGFDLVPGIVDDPHEMAAFNHAYSKIQTYFDSQA